MIELANIFGVENWLIILLIVLVLFGGKKIPELLRGVGRGVGELQKGLAEGKQHFDAGVTDEPKVVADAPRETIARTHAE